MPDYKFILEAAQFYQKCIEEIKTSLIQEVTLVNNEFMKFEAKVFKSPSTFEDVQLVGKFKLNSKVYDINLSFRNPIVGRLSKEEIINAVSSEVAKVIAKEMLVGLSV